MKAQQPPAGAPDNHSDEWIVEFARSASNSRPGGPVVEVEEVTLGGESASLPRAPLPHFHRKGCMITFYCDADTFHIPERIWNVRNVSDPRASDAVLIEKSFFDLFQVVFEEFESEESSLSAMNELNERVKAERAAAKQQRRLNAPEAVDEKEPSSNTPTPAYWFKNPAFDWMNELLEPTKVARSVTPRTGEDIRRSLPFQKIEGGRVQAGIPNDILPTLFLPQGRGPLSK